MPLYVVRSAPVRSPEPAAPTQCTSGQVGSAPAVPADRPTNAAPATAAAPASAEIRRNIKPQPFLALPDRREVHRLSRLTCYRGGPRSTKWCDLLALSRPFVRLGKKVAQTKAAPTRRRAPLRGTTKSSLEDHVGRAYLMILVTRPAPTVRPPSRIAKRRPSSIATGWISFTEMSVLSPGMTISVPSGSVTTPVTSVVRK